MERLAFGTNLYQDFELLARVATVGFSNAEPICAQLTSYAFGLKETSIVDIWRF